MSNKGAFIPPQNGAAGGGGGGGSAISSIVAGTATATGPAVSFADSNGVTFGITGNTVTASIPAGAAPGGISAGTSSVELGTVVLSNSHNVSFGLAGSTVTASAGFTQSTQPQEPVLVRGSGTNIESIATNSTLSFDWAPDGANGRGARFIATNVGAAVRLQGFYSAMGVSAGTASVFGATGNVVFSNSHNVSFGLNGSTVTASATAEASGFIGASGGGSSVDGAGSLLRFIDANGLAWAVSSTNATQVRVNANYSAPRALSAGTTSMANGTAVFSNANGVTFGLDGSTITASVAGATPETPFAISGGGSSQSTGTVVFSNSNGITFGLNAGTMTASVSTQPGTPFGVSAGTQSVSTGTLVFSNSNNVTFGMSGSSRITASIPSGATATGNLGGIAAAGQTRTNGTIVFSNSNGVTFGLNGSTMTASVGGGGPTLNFLNLNTAGNANSSMATASGTVFRTALPLAISGTRLNFRLVGVGASPTPTLTGSLGVYTMSGSTASLLESRSITFVASNVLNQGTNSGSIANLSLTPGDYLFYVKFSHTSNEISVVGATVFAGATESPRLFFDAGLVSGTGPPASIHVTRVEANFARLAAPWMQIVGS